MGKADAERWNTTQTTTSLVAAMTSDKLPHRYSDGELISRLNDFFGNRAASEGGVASSRPIKPPTRTMSTINEESERDRDWRYR